MQRDFRYAERNSIGPPMLRTYFRDNHILIKNCWYNSKIKQNNLLIRPNNTSVGWLYTHKVWLWSISSKSLIDILLPLVKLLQACLEQLAFRFYTTIATAWRATRGHPLAAWLLYSSFGYQIWTFLSRLVKNNTGVNDVQHRGRSLRVETLRRGPPFSKSIPYFGRGEGPNS